MRKYIFALILLALGLLAVPALAQTSDATVDTSSSGSATVTTEPLVSSDTATVVVATTAVDTTTEPELEGVKVVEPTKIPGAFGLWWRNLRENISVALTLNPVKKAEKRLVFAEERTKLAEYILANSTDEKVKIKAEDMLAKAQEHMDKIGELKDKLVADTGERATRLKNNLVKHEARSEQALKRMEEKVSGEGQQKFQELREKSLEGSKRLLNALDNPNLPPEAKDFLQAVKTRIEETASTTKFFREEKKDLLEKAKSGDESAKEELKNLREERKAALEAVRENFKEQREELKDAVKTGEVATSTARKILQVENKVTEKIEDRREAVRERAQEREENVKELKKKYQQQPLPPEPQL